MKLYNVAIIHNDIHTKLMNTESKRLHTLYTMQYSNDYFVTIKSK